eukprot:8231605-Ditylum_brightwellii.AAC.2
MTFPLAGDKCDTRWKSAHCMYYQHVDLSSTGNTPNNININVNINSANTSKTIHVIYEGVFNKGDNKHDGQ